MTSDDVAARARKAVPNRGLTWIAEIGARQHRYAIEYIEQAPVLVIGATFGAAIAKPTSGESALIAMRFKRIEGMRLKEAMREFHLPYPLRKLRSTAVTPSFTSVIWALRNVPPSALSQAIPDKPRDQMAWLGAMRSANLRAKYRSRHLSSAARHWLATKIVAGQSMKARELAAHAADIADMFVDGSFNPLWTFEEAVNAHNQWAANQARRVSAENFAARYGVSLDHEVDYTPQPNDPLMIGEFEIVPLRRGEDLVVEGALMRHCVSSYMAELLSARSRIYSIRKNGRRVATLELSSGRTPIIKQIKGPCNSTVSSMVGNAAVEFASSLQRKKKSSMDKLKAILGN